DRASMVLGRSPGGHSGLLVENVGRLDERLDLIARLEFQRLGRPTCDHSNNLETADFHENLCHHISKLDRFHNRGKLIAGAEHCDLHELVLWARTINPEQYY